MAQQGSDLGPLEKFVLGGVSAIIFQSATAPFERVKILRQCQGEMVKQGRITEPYEGSVDCAVRTYRNEGALAFWRGNLVQCLHYFPLQALTFALKEKMKDIFKSSESDGCVLAFSKNVASGAAAGAVALFIVYSLDYARTRLAADVKVTGEEGSEREFNGVIDVYKKTFKSDGLIGLYRGFAISCVGIIVYRACYFGLNDVVKYFLGKNTFPYFLGFAVTVCAGLISYPLDTIRRRMIVTSGQEVKYRGSWDCAVQVLRSEGAMAFWNGAGVSILRGIVGFATYVVFNKVKGVYVHWRLN